MFKPEYILAYVAAFGLSDTIKLIAAKFRRLGKNREVSYIMAKELVYATVFVAE